MKKEEVHRHLVADGEGGRFLSADDEGVNPRPECVSSGVGQLLTPHIFFFF